jgi:hypothetical protein
MRHIATEHQLYRLMGVHGYGSVMSPDEEASTVPCNESSSSDRLAHGSASRGL